MAVHSGDLLKLLLICVLLPHCFGADTAIDVTIPPRNSPARLLRPSFAVESRGPDGHVFAYVGQELVDKTYSVPWLHLIEVSLQPDVKVVMDTEIALSFNFTVVCTDKERLFEVSISTPDPNVLSIRGSGAINISCEAATSDSLYRLAPSQQPPSDLVSELPRSSVTKAAIDSPYLYIDGTITLQLSSGIIGKTYIEFTLDEAADDVGNGHREVPSNDTNPNTHREVVKYEVAVLRNVRPVDRLFRVVIYAMQILVMVGFGIKLDVKVVKEHLWKPVAPVMGLCCQYILMPLIAFGVAKSVDIDNKVVALGIFIAGCCPGGGGSNMYSYLLRGNLSLSITMTAISTVAALGMLPLWVYTLGYTFLKDQDLQIPFSMVAVSLSILITPLVIGIFLRQKVPKVANRIQKLLKPIIVVMSLILIVVGIYSNLFIFRLFKPKVVLAACLLPYIGYIAGGVIALVFQQPWKTVKTIAIETGMQNTSIAYILMTSSFPSPEGDIGSVAPLASAVMTPIPLFIVTVIYLSYRRIRKKYAPVKQTEDAKDTANHDDQELNDTMKG